MTVGRPFRAEASGSRHPGGSLNANVLRTRRLHRLPVVDHDAELVGLALTRRHRSRVQARARGREAPAGHGRVDRRYRRGHLRGARRKSRRRLGAVIPGLAIGGVDVLYRPHGAVDAARGGHAYAARDPPAEDRPGRRRARAPPDRARAEGAHRQQRAELGVRGGDATAAVKERLGALNRRAWSLYGGIGRRLYRNDPDHAAHHERGAVAGGSLRRHPGASSIAVPARASSRSGRRIAASSLLRLDLSVRAEPAARRARRRARRRAHHAAAVEHAGSPAARSASRGPSRRAR